MPVELSAKRALIFRITHIDNLPWLLANGLHCAGGPQAPGFITIGNPDLIGRRAARIVREPPGGTLGDYVPFYFTPKSPMLLNIKTGHGGIQRRDNDELIIVISAIPTLVAQDIRFLFTDRHAYTPLARFSANPTALETMIDWDILRRSDFRRSEDDPAKMERYQAEALVYRHLPVTALLGIACVSDAACRRTESLVRDAGLALKVVARPAWYF